MRRMVVTVNSESLGYRTNNFEVYRTNNFEVIIKDGEETVFNEYYENRDSVSFDKRKVTDNKPYVTDVLCQLKERFHVDKLALEAGEGCHKPYYKDVMDFDRKYCMESTDLAIIKEKPSVKSVVFIKQDAEYGTFDISVYDGDMSVFMADDGEIDSDIPEGVSLVSRYRSWNSFGEVFREFQKNIPFSDVSTHVAPADEGLSSAVIKIGIDADEFQEGLQCSYNLRQMVFPAESQNYPDMKMTVTVKSGLNSDGFDVKITADGKPVLDHDYRYGYDAAYSKVHVSERAPYVTDVLQGLIDKYHISDFTVEAGKNVFAGTDVRAETVEDFKTEYCSGLKLPEMADAKLEEPVFLTKDILDQLWKEAGADNVQRM